MRKAVALILLFSLLPFTLSALGRTENHASGASQTAILFSFTDSLGRIAEFSSSPVKIAAAGPVAAMFLSAVCPEYLVNLDSPMSAERAAYLSPLVSSLKGTGALYGSKSTLNAEQILSLGADVIIDMGDFKSTIASDLDALEKQTGLKCIFIESDLENMASAFRMLGSLLPSKASRCEELALYVEETLALAQSCRGKIEADETLSVLYSFSADGLGVNADGSSQAQVLYVIGARNAASVKAQNNKSGGTIINFEQLYIFNPDVILFTDSSLFESVSSDVRWNQLPAIKQNHYFLVPSLPYNWLSNPPSFNMLIGVRWLGNLLYPQYFNLDMVSEAQRFYALFYGYELSTQEALSLLGN